MTRERAQGAEGPVRDPRGKGSEGGGQACREGGGEARGRGGEGLVQGWGAPGGRGVLVGAPAQEGARRRPSLTPRLSSCWSVGPGQFVEAPHTHSAPHPYSQRPQ